jgi:hypothetical protein
MPALDFTTAQTTLNTIIGDSADTTFSSSEKQRALTKAWNDSYVVNEVWDTSLSYSTGVYQYTRPAGLSSIQGIYISVTGSTQPFPDPIDSSLWEEVNSKIQFSSRVDSLIPGGSVLYLKGHYKLTTADNISNINMQEYVLALAGVYTLKMLAHKKANLFTKNDVTMSELIGLKRDLQQDVVELRRRLRTAWESA